MSIEADFPYIKEGVVTYAVDSLLQAASYMQRPPYWQSVDDSVEYFAGVVNDVPEYARLLEMSAGVLYSYNHWGMLRFDPEQNERSLIYYSLLSGFIMQKAVITRLASDPSFTDPDFFSKVIQRSGDITQSSLIDAEPTDYKRVIKSLFELRPVVEIEAERIQNNLMNI